MTEIVRTPGVLGGFPQLAGRRIGVHHILGTLKTCSGENEAADGDQHRGWRAAVTYAEAHPGVMAEVDREREASLERVRERAEYPEGVKPPEE